VADRFPWIAAIHAVNALAVFWVAVQLARSVSWNPVPGGTRDR